MGGIFWEEFFGRNSLGGILWEEFVKGIDLFVKILVFVKILSQWKEEGRILILRSASASSSHLKSRTDLTLNNEFNIKCLIFHSSPKMNLASSI